MSINLCAGADADVHVQRVWFTRALLLAASRCTLQTFPVISFSCLLSIDEERSLTLLLSFPSSITTVHAARRHCVLAAQTLRMLAKQAEGLRRVRCPSFVLTASCFLPFRAVRFRSVILAVPSLSSTLNPSPLPTPPCSVFFGYSLHRVRLPAHDSLFWSSDDVILLHACDEDSDADAEVYASEGGYLGWGCGCGCGCGCRCRRRRGVRFGTRIRRGGVSSSAAWRGDERDGNGDGTGGCESVAPSVPLLPAAGDSAEGGA
ncbi:hypothetical protein B0H19DRAFT_541735 [Mycena capillaripes]|nr:hypothetical protein B0H19DRAFT_541735 [Mycena capillaripes]